MLRRTTVVITMVAGILACNLVSVGASRPPGAPDRYLVVIVMDGFRPDYMRLAPMPNLQSLMHSGTTYNRAWVGQLETETPTGHATIVTGVYPRKHSVIGFGWRSLSNGAFTWMPTDLRQLAAGSMENLIEAGGAPTLSDLMHRRYPGSRSASVSGEKYYAADAMGTGADYVLFGRAVKHGIQVATVGKHVPPRVVNVSSMDSGQIAYASVQDGFVAHMAMHLLATLRPRTMLINLPGTDIEGHLTGGIVDQPDMRGVVMQTDKAIGQIVDWYRRAGLLKRTLFVVTSDHGMVPNGHIVPIKNVYAGLRATNAPAIEDDLLTTGGFVFLRNPLDAATVASGVAAHHFAGIEGALYRVPVDGGYAFRAEPSTARSLGQGLTRAYIDLANTLAAPAGPEVVLPYREDTMGLTVKKYGSRWGNHGGLSWRVQHIPLIISGPGVAHHVSWFPAQLVDIAPTIERLMGLQIPLAVDGLVLSDAQATPGSADGAAQATAGPARSRDVRALMQHSRAQRGIAMGR